MTYLQIMVANIGYNTVVQGDLSQLLIFDLFDASCRSFRKKTGNDPWQKTDRGIPGL